MSTFSIRKRRYIDNPNPLSGKWLRLCFAWKMLLKVLRQKDLFLLEINAMKFESPCTNQENQQSLRGLQQRFENLSVLRTLFWLSPARRFFLRFAMKAAKPSASPVRRTHFLLPRITRISRIVIFHNLTISNFYRGFHNFLCLFRWKKRAVGWLFLFVIKLSDNFAEKKTRTNKNV